MTAYRDNNTTDSHEISLRDVALKLRYWCRFLIRKWPVIICVGCLGGLLGYFYAASKPPVYTATTTFVLESGSPSAGGLSQYSGFASMMGLDLGGNGGDIFQGDNLLMLYRSRNMIKKTLLSPVVVGKSELLVDRYIACNDLRNLWKTNPVLANVQFANYNFKTNRMISRTQDSILGSIINDINKNYLFVSRPDKKLSIIKIDVAASDELFAMAFNNQIVATVNEFYRQTKTRKSIDNINILQRKTDSVRAVMNGAIYSAAAASDATPNLNATRQIQRNVPLQRSQFSAEASKAILAQLVQNLELSKMALLKEAPLVQVVDDPVLPLSKSVASKTKAAVVGMLLCSVLLCFLLIIWKTISKISKLPESAHG